MLCIYRNYFEFYPPFRSYFIACPPLSYGVPLVKPKKFLAGFRGRSSYENRLSHSFTSYVFTPSSKFKLRKYFTSGPRRFHGGVVTSWWTSGNDFRQKFWMQWVFNGERWQSAEIGGILFNGRLRSNENDNFILLLGSNTRNIWCKLVKGTWVSYIELFN